MTFDEASRELAAAGRKLPRSAMQWCLDHWDEAGPRFVDLLDRYARAEERSKRDENVLFFALHLLGEKAETTAFAPLCRLLCDAEATETVLGDGITTTLSRILISTYDGNPRTLQTMIETEAADEFIRDAALAAHAYLAATGRMSHEEMRAYLLHLFGAMQPQAESFVWTGWVIAVANLGYADLAPQAEQLIRREFVSRDHLRLSDFRKNLDRTLSDPERMAGFEHDRLTPFADAIHELGQWYWFSEKPDSRPTQTELLRFTLPQPYTNPTRNLGRNDPCPCGSGQKYKKCCLAVGATSTGAESFDRIRLLAAQ